MKTLSSLAFLILFSYQQSLQDDPILSEYFSTKEVSQLDSIRVFFNQQLLKKCQGSGDISVCYRQYFDRLSEVDSIDLEISYSEQQALYKRIDESVYKEIWQRRPASVYVSADEDRIDSKLLSYNMQGQYMRFLEKVAREEPYFEKYVEPIKASGDLNPSLLGGFQYDPSGLDFNEPRHQLILAIHFLTFNYQRAN